MSGILAANVCQEREWLRLVVLVLNLAFKALLVLADPLLHLVVGHLLVECGVAEGGGLLHRSHVLRLSSIDFLGMFLLGTL